MLGYTYKSDLNNNLTRIPAQDVVDNVTADEFFADGSMADGVKYASETAEKVNGSIDENGNFIKQLLSDTLDTQSKQILGEYTFGTSGAIAIKTDANNGMWLSPTGILGKKGGVISFALETDGDASFGGALIGASGTFGTITAGTLTGCQFNANGGAGTDVSIGNDGYLRFKYGGSNKAFIAVDSSGNMYIDSDANILMQANDDIILTFNEDGGASSFTIFNDSVVALILTDANHLSVAGGIYPGGDIQTGGTFRSSDGSGGVNKTRDIVTSIYWEGGDIKYKYRQYQWKDGILVSEGSENTANIGYHP